jgi:hypothetical protein
MSICFLVQKPDFLFDERLSVLDWGEQALSLSMLYFFLIIYRVFINNRQLVFNCFLLFLGRYLFLIAYIINITIFLTH